MKTNSRGWLLIEELCRELWKQPIRSIGSICPGEGLLRKREETKLLQGHHHRIEAVYDLLGWLRSGAISQLSSISGGAINSEAIHCEVRHVFPLNFRLSIFF